MSSHVEIFPWLPQQDRRWGVGAVTAQGAALCALAEIAGADGWTPDRRLGLAFVDAIRRLQAADAEAARYLEFGGAFPPPLLPFAHDLISAGQNWWPAFGRALCVSAGAKDTAVGWLFDGVAGRVESFGSVHSGCVVISDDVD